MRGIDTADVTTGKAHELLAAGVQAVGIYLREDRAPKEAVDGLRSVGIKVFSIWERGYPTSADYFASERGTSDAAEACSYADSLGQPPATPIFACVDCDVSPDACRDYMAAFHAECSKSGYLAGVYGSGLVCSTFVAEGIAHYGYLAQSSGWPGFEDYKSDAAIVQGSGETVCGLDADGDEILNETVLW